MAIATAEHHQMVDPVLSPYDIADRLGELWREVEREAGEKKFTLDADCIIELNQRITSALDMNIGAFRNRDGWESLVKECNLVGGIDEDPSHLCSWFFSALYWSHLESNKLATAWFFINAMRIQHELEEYRLEVKNLGLFLDGLSGSGPPLWDGQTFYPERFST